jgi:PPM family protein phosphatase
MAISITIRKPAGLCEKGKRANNEDSIYPSLDKRSANEQLFMVCDGVGGAAKGDVASKLVCETFSSLFKKATQSDPPFVGSVLKVVEDGIQEYIEDNPIAAGMATTLTLLHFHSNGATVAHIGDSRVYHIRKGEILYRSEDHSFVQGLIKEGIITPEEARKHPRRNVITRAIQGSKNRTVADTHVIHDIQTGDYFFLCSDGILESVSDEDLCALLISPISNQQRIAQIKKLCTAHSRDNFSCYLIEVARCSGSLDENNHSVPLMSEEIHPEEEEEEEEAMLEPHQEESLPLYNQRQEMPLDSPTSFIQVERRADPVTTITPMHSSQFKETVTAHDPIPEVKIPQAPRPVAQEEEDKFKWIFLFLLLVLFGFLIYFFYSNNI